ncbi:MAG: rhomboid family intramembrane serine protease [Candidatus Thermoplasmatota archaeon]
MLSNLSLLAIALIVAAIVAGLSNRVLVSGALILANLGVFILSLFGSQVPALGFEGSGLYPTIQAELALASPNLANLAPLGFLQLLTSLFVHFDGFHLLGNMLVLVAFGLPFEQRIGSRRFLAIYLAGGLIASVVQLTTTWGAPTLLMGASGSIFAILGAFAIRYPNQVIAVPLLFVFLPMRVVFGAIAYIAFQVVFLALYQDVPGFGGTAYYAHIGGAAAGIVLGLAIVRPGKAKGPVAVDLQALVPFARDASTKTVWDHMVKNHDEPAVFQAWLDRFFRTATCPTCGQRVAPRAAGKVVCMQNHSFDVRKPTPAPAVAARQG